MAFVALRWLTPLLLCAAAPAEEALEKVRIQVLDTSGAAIGGARVSLACAGAGTQMEDYSNNVGIVMFPVRSTTCDATVSADKFESTVTPVDLSGRLESLEIQLQPLQSRTEIVVAAGPGAIETTRTTAA